jgi:hypothetical protein
MDNPSAHIELKATSRIFRLLDKIMLTHRHELLGLFSTKYPQTKTPCHTKECKKTSRVVACSQLYDTSWIPTESKDVKRSDGNSR